MSTPLPGRVLLTGSSGVVGNTVVNGLVRAGIDTVALDVRPNPPYRADPHPLPTRFASINDRAGLNAAMVGIDQVVHLAANPNTRADLETQLVGPNIVGLKNVLDAARYANVQRVVLASSVQVARYDQRPAVAGLAHQQCKNWYAVTKAIAELAGEMYHLKRGMNVMAVRIGWFVSDGDDYRGHREHILRHLREENAHDHYLSSADAARFFNAAVTAEWSGFHVLNAMSKPRNPDDPEFDLQPARDLLGYEPQDTLPEPAPAAD